MEFFKSIKPSDICFDLFEVDIDATVAQEKETCTNWINNVLERCGSNYRVEDLYTDIRSGIVLSHIIYAFTGVEIKMTPEEYINNKPVMAINILLILQALERDGLYLVNTNILDIYDGRPTVVLGLVWQIILHYDIRRGGVQSYYTLPPITNQSSASPHNDDINECLPTKRSLANKLKSVVIDPVLSLTKIKDLVRSICESGHCNKVIFTWLKKEICVPYGIKITNLSSDWMDGVAFMALIHRFYPALVDMDLVRKSSPRSNILKAFEYASEYLGIRNTLDVNDILSGSIKENAVAFYVWQFMRLNVKRVRKNSKVCSEKLRSKRGSVSSTGSYASSPGVFTPNKERHFTFKEEMLTDQPLYILEDDMDRVF
uniref:Calponin-homology (CH) domain-containing protein n=1 Tax=Strongyloides papillosus TaxID=174720 RepID=A0A0N5BYF0_STREA